MQIELGVLAHELRRGDAVRAGGMAMGVVAVSSRLQIVDVDGAVAALRGDEFVERVPGDALDVVVVFRDFADDVAVLDVYDARHKVGAADGERLAVGAPSHVVELLLGGTAHELDAPELLFELRLAFEVGGDVAEAGFAAVAGHPEEHVAVVAGGGEQLALGTEAHHVDDARMALKRGEVLDARRMRGDDGGARDGRGAGDGSGRRDVGMHHPDACVVVASGGCEPPTLPAGHDGRMGELGRRGGGCGCRGVRGRGGRHGGCGGRVELGEALSWRHAGCLTHVVVEHTPEVVGGDGLEGAAVDGLGVMPADLEGCARWLEWLRSAKRCRRKPQRGWCQAAVSSSSARAECALAARAAYAMRDGDRVGRAARYLFGAGSYQEAGSALLASSKAPSMVESVR
ncbi:hypothetical protein L1887_51198 [Cichorium endivia]|nr:hypothetical protein L1887_51198 [Cichorium endivia]